jgi:uncharacterized protein YndB with AHSA1/START domain
LEDSSNKRIRKNSLNRRTKHVASRRPTSLVVSPTYPASVERVFKAWTDANQLGQWFALGAEVIVDIRDVMGHGQMSVLRDRGGATIALWHAKK